MAWFFSKNSSKDLKKFKEDKNYFSQEKTFSTWIRVKEILVSHIADCHFFYSKEDGLDLLLQKGLIPFIRDLANFMLENPSNDFYIYCVFNDKNPIYSPLSFFDSWELGSFFSKEDIERKNIHESRLIKISPFKTQEEISSLKEACHFLDKAYKDLAYQSQNSKILIFKRETNEPSTFRYGALTLQEQQEQKDIIKTLRESSLFSLYAGESLSTLNLDIASLKELMQWAVKFLSFQTGISSVRLGFDLANEEVDINDDFIRFINYVHKVFTKPLIEKLLEKLNLKSDWSFKPIPLANQKEQIQAEKNLSETIEKYTKILTEIDFEKEPFLYEEIRKKLEFLLTKEL